MLCCCRPKISPLITEETVPRPRVNDKFTAQSKRLMLIKSLPNLLLLLTRNERVILAQQTEEVSLRLNQGRKSWHSSAWRWLRHTGPIGADDRAHTGVSGCPPRQQPSKAKAKSPHRQPGERCGRCHPSDRAIQIGQNVGGGHSIAMRTPYL